MASFFWGLVGGMVAWVATMILGQPIYRFLNLRAEAAEILARYERDNSEDPGRDAREVGWQAERKRAYQECGSKLIAFAISNVAATRLIRRRPLRGVRYYPRSAGEALMTLGDLSPGSPDRSTLIQAVISGLQLDFGPSRRGRRA
jgi:hypothetical protein